MRIRATLCLLLGICFAASPAIADWDPGQPAKWVQLPDLTPLGIDVSISREYILADDFECREPGPITDVHIWGSWLNDRLPFGEDPSAVEFLLSIHKDIPASQSPTDYSMPGELLWEFLFPAGAFSVRQFAGPIDEGWMDPPDEYLFPGDQFCWQYNFFIDPAQAFVQEGSPQNPVVYWLKVRAIPLDPAAQFGWKTSEEHWNDDAVWGRGPDPYFDPWFELRYPPPHELAGQSIDLAFVITGEQPLELDFGDVPDPTYPTLLASDGARHIIVPNILLGGSIDPEPNGQPDANATGDDNDGNDDEDGVFFTSGLVQGGTATVDVIASVGGYLNLWIDFAGDGSWAEAGDHVFVDLTIGPGVNNLSFTVPAAARPGLTFARFRFSTARGVWFTGLAPDGEVEDYAIGIDEGQARLGDRVWDDLNANGIQDPGEPGLPGVTVELYDCGGTLLDTTVTDLSGTYAFTTVPGNDFVRFRLPAGYQFSPRDQGADDTVDSDADPVTGNTICTTLDPGEADLTWDAGMYRRLEEDFGDAPEPPDGTPGYPTTLSFNGARHTIVPGIFMGTSVDAEPNGQPNPTATGDDLDGNDDEDGVVFTSPISPGIPATVDVFVTVPGHIDAWIDFGGDNSWAEPGDQIFAAQPVAPGVNSLTFNVPPNVVVGAPSFARVRYSTPGSLPFDGPAPDGEVEDYQVGFEPVALEYGDAPNTYRTLLAQDGPRHVLRPGLQLGPNIDVEIDGQPHPNALGDDLNNLPDEDGVAFVSPIVPGGTTTIQVDAPGGGMLDAWMDFDFDGMFLTLGEQIFASQSLTPGINTLSFTVPAGSSVGTTFARFRLSANGGLAYVGYAPDGEVEDYEVRIEEPQVYKWLQEPDLSVLGIDVNASQDFVLADDFLCTETGRITTIHVWGSWRGDYFPFQDVPGAVTFFLSLHRDIPADPTNGEHSRPGELLWQYVAQPGTFEVELFAGDIEEGWMDPPEDYQFPADFSCWKYTFRIPAAEAFRQVGTLDNPVVYWLDLKAFPEDPQAYFGWKTSLTHWNDDAVWGRGPEPYPGPWFELRYPPGHPQEPESIDLAFALEGAPEPSMDFGDAPDPTYETLWVNDGARHVVDATVFLGNTVDIDADGQPEPSAMGDDLFDGIDDEDGVVWLTPLRPNVDAQIDVIASAAGYVSLWVDMLGNGNWSDAIDQMFIDYPVATGVNTIQWKLPITGGQGVVTFARIRYSTQPGLTTWTGPAVDGEVEDYEVFVELDATDLDDPVPQRLELRQNYPNPFNPQTIIEYNLSRDGWARLAVYDQRGALVRVLVDSWNEVGPHDVVWDGKDQHSRPVGSGVYTILLRAEGEERRMHAVLIR